MSQALFPYYERELSFIRQMSQEFARRYPAAAGRLLLEPTHSGDPHIERMIESFALLAGRVRHKLDDEFPELTDALLGVMYPHYLAPVPSMALVQFELDSSLGELPDGFQIRQHSVLRTAPVGNLRCQFRTGYPVTLWPITLEKARLQSPPFPPEYRPPRRTAAAIRLEFRCDADLTFDKLSLDKLRLFLQGDNYVVATLYELLFNHTTQVLFRSLGEGPQPPPITLAPHEALHQVGFDDEHGLLPYPPQAFSGYRLLSEFFAFREKFLFADLAGWKRAAAAGFQKKLEVVFFLNRKIERLEEWIDASTFRLGCAPIVNLFPQIAEPVTISQRKYEYRIVPNVAHQMGMEVYSVDKVTSTDPTTNITTAYEPFYSIRHASRNRDRQAFWYSTRRGATSEQDRGTDVFLNLVDLSFSPKLPADQTLVVRTTCSNRDLPVRLQQVGERLFFELEGAAPLSAIRCLKTPTSPLRPPPRRGRYWGLISHLNLNYLSLCDPIDGRAALQEILHLYDFSDPKAGQEQLSEVIEQLIEGITGLHTRRVVGRPSGSGFCRGMEVTVELDEEKYVGTGSFLFACVLERFLGLYTSINSFSQLIAKSAQTQGTIKKWPPRAGDQVLL